MFCNNLQYSVLSTIICRIIAKATCNSFLSNNKDVSIQRIVNNREKVSNYIFFNLLESITDVYMVI